LFVTHELWVMRLRVRMKMKKIALAFLLVVGMAGCKCPEKALILQLRENLVVSTRPALVDALDKAKKKNGKPAYIDAYRDEKVATVDTSIESIDRVYPPEEPYVREALPWKE
jgi:hypothetical protein